MGVVISIAGKPLNTPKRAPGLGVPELRRQAARLAVLRRHARGIEGRRTSVQLGVGRPSHTTRPLDEWRLRGYTTGMKTAVSLPDRVYREAEGHAKRTRKSRSQLYAEALAEYLARHAPDEVTEAMNVVVDELGEAAPDSFVQRAGRRMLWSVEW